MKKITPILLAATMLSPFAQADALSDMSDKVKKAMTADIRTDKETSRDRNRRPVETLAFLGIKDNMRVLEIMPGGGWYTKLLAPALRDKGEFYVGMGTRRVVENLLNKKGFDKVKVLSEKSEFKFNKEERLYDVSNISFEQKNLDAVLTFRNYHNLSYQARTDMNKAAFAALKPGGIYGVVDHTRRHMQKMNDENRRRFDPVLAIKEIQAAGFEFVDYSDLHYKLDDELVYEVGRRSVSGNTDRFTFLFKKPE